MREARVPLASSQAVRTAARVVAVGLLLSLATIMGVTYGVMMRVLDQTDPTRMAQSILAHETLFRAGIAGNVLYAIELFVLAVAVYVTLENVDRLLAMLAALGWLVHAVVWLYVSLNLFAALRLISQPEYAPLALDQKAVLARLLLSGFDPYYVALLFWSLGSTVAAVLWLRSGWIPGWLALFGILASTWAAACTCCLFVAPSFRRIVDLTLFDVPLVLFEIVLGIRVLAWGLRSPGQEARP